jgi:hypothetical protein
MKYAVEMGSGAMIYIPSFKKIGSGNQKLMGWDSQTHRQHGDLISLFSFSQTKENRLTIKERRLTIQFTDIFALYSKNHTRQMHQVGRMQYFMLQCAIPVVTTVFQSLILLVFSSITRPLEHPCWKGCRLSWGTLVTDVSKELTCKV